LKKGNIGYFVFISSYVTKKKNISVQLARAMLNLKLEHNKELSEKNTDEGRVLIFNMRLKQQLFLKNYRKKYF
jgi:hypothetical protein